MNSSVPALWLATPLLLLLPQVPVPAARPEVAFQHGAESVPDDRQWTASRQPVAEPGVPAQLAGPEFEANALLVAAATSPPFQPHDPESEPPESISAEAHSVPDGLSTSDWSSIRAAYETGRHQVFAEADGHRAHNPGQRWTTLFDGRGFSTTPDAGGWTWGFTLASYGFGEDEQTVTDPQRVTAEGGRLAYDWDDVLSEWYVNDGRGLEHGYTVRERPAGDRGPLTLTLAIRGGLLPEISADGRDVRFVDANGGAALDYAGLIVLDADGVELEAGWRATTGGLLLRVDDKGARYPLTVDPVAQQAYLKASNTDAGDGFGYSVSVSGDTVVVGAPGEDSSATGVDGNQGDNSTSDPGAAYVFVRSGSTWSQQAYLKASNTDAGDVFGFSVSVSGDTVVVGAVQESSNDTGVDGNQGDNSAQNAGAAYVFVRSGSTWSQQAYLKASNTDAGDWFGYSVSVSGDTVVVGAHRESSNATGVDGNQGDNSALWSGAAYVFVRNGSTWSQQAYLKASNTDAGDWFGHPVSVSGDTVVVGAVQESSNDTGVDGNQGDNSAVYAGAAYVFVRSVSIWSQQAYLKASNTGAIDRFGSSVSVSGDTIVVGAQWEDSSATGVDGNQGDNVSALMAGAAYVFVRNGSTWSQQAYLKASNTDGNDLFGLSVSVSGDTVVVGAPYEWSNSTGVNGNQGDNSAQNAGAAYVFVRSGSTWSQQAYLKASNTDSTDSFGFSVSVSGGIVVVGAGWEDSNATGVDGNQSDTSAWDSGAAYVFELPATCGVSQYGPTTGVNYGVLSSAASPTAGANFPIDLSGFTGGGTALLLLSANSAATPGFGGTLLVDPFASILGPGNFLPVTLAAGVGQIVLPLPAGTGGLTFYGQAARFDLTQPAWIALTNGLAVTICP